jgi:curved DNA-binding protein CbpA
LLQQLFRKQVTACLSIKDPTGDLSDVYLRSGYPVHVHRPVDSDRLDRVLIENGVVTERAVEMAMPMVSSGMRLGEALERMGALTKQTLADVLKAQMRRKLTRLFCIRDGSFEVFVENHAYGEGDELTAMRVDPRTLYYPAIRMAYDLPRATHELSRLWGQQFRLGASASTAHISAMQIPGDDPVVAGLRFGWLTLEKVDPLASRPFEARAVLLALYYGDMLDRQNLMDGMDKPTTDLHSTDNLLAVSPPSGEVPMIQADPDEDEINAEPTVPNAVVVPPAVLMAAMPALARPPVDPPVSSIPPSTPMVLPTAAPPAPMAPPPPIISPLSVAPSAPAASPVRIVPPPLPRQAPSPSPEVPAIPPATLHFSPAPEAGAKPPARSPSPETSKPRISASMPAIPAEASKPRITASVPAIPVAEASKPRITASVPAIPAAETNKPRITASMPAISVGDPALRAAITSLAQKLDHLSYFELLEVSESAPESEVSAAFFRAARRYHPDRLAGAGLGEMAPQAERILARMSEAAMTLGDPTKRADYMAERSGKKKAPENTIPSVVEAETAFLRGEVFLKKGDHTRAIECFTLACRANASEPQFRAYLAWARFDNPKGRKEAVVREVQRIIADVVTVQPKFARGHYWLGLIWKFLNEPDRAERCFREAVEHDKEFIEATRELRLCEMRRQRGGPSKSAEASRGGLMGRLFKR